MSSYFIVSVKLGKPESRLLYEAYIRQVRPLVEAQGGEYLVRSEDLDCWPGEWRPDRVIVIRFPDRKALDRCFQSPEYRAIKQLRLDSVSASAVIVDGC